MHVQFKPFVALFALAGFLVLAGCVTGKKAAVRSEATVEPTDLGAYRKVEAPAIPTPVLQNPDFENGAGGWTLPAGYRHVRGEGRNGTGALLYERSNPADYPLGRQAIHLQPGARYHFSVWIKTEDVRGDDVLGATFCVDFLRDGKWLTGLYPRGLMGTTDWTLVAISGTVPPDANACSLTLYMRKGSTGKVWFDDVAITPLGRPGVAHLLRPLQSRFLTDDGQFAIHWDFFMDPNERRTELMSHVEVKRGDTVVKTAQFPCRDLLSLGNLGHLPAGSLTLRVMLLDPAAKAILSEQEIPATCVDPATIPSTAVRMDARGRTMIGNQPFLPIGLYLGSVDTATLETIAASPFNCVMPYGSLSLALKDSPRQGAERVREVLDACDAKGVKVIFSIKDVYEGARHCPPQWNGVTGATAITTAAVNAFRDHPALLAWYICDELPLSQAPEVEARRRLLHQLDPWHPSWAVYYQFTDFAGYASTADILGVDPYPIQDPAKHDMNIVEFAMRAANTTLGTGMPGGLPLWAVPQAFNMALYTFSNGRRLDRTEDRELVLRKGRTPTEEEMRSMSLRMAIGGARGFIFYSYYDLLKPAVKPDYEQTWGDLCRIGALLRELQPFLYSEEKAPELSVKTIKGEVNAAAYKTADGKVAVLVTGKGPGESEAELVIAGTDTLTSRFGKCDALRGGRYRFKGADICSDILQSP